MQAGRGYEQEEGGIKSRRRSLGTDNNNQAFHIYRITLCVSFFSPSAFERRAGNGIGKQSTVAIRTKNRSQSQHAQSFVLLCFPPENATDKSELSKILHYLLYNLHEAPWLDPRKLFNDITLFQNEHTPPFSAADIKGGLQSPISVDQFSYCRAGVTAHSEHNNCNGQDITPINSERASLRPSTTSQPKLRTRSALTPEEHPFYVRTNS